MNFVSCIFISKILEYQCFNIISPFQAPRVACRCTALFIPHVMGLMRFFRSECQCKLVSFNNQSLQAFNLLSFVAVEPHYLQDAVPWSPDTCSTQRSHVHRVLLHGASNRDTHLCPPHSNSLASLTTTYVWRSGRIINGARSGRTTPQDSALQFQTPVHTPLE